jgi:phage terminase Nu1 subunit (DNA packaging protein)
MRGFAIQDIVGKYDLELMAVAATACAAVGSPAQQDWVYAQLEPYAGLHVVVGGCAAYHGAVDHLLGLLAAALGQTERAAGHFNSAIAMHDRLGTPAWAQLSRRELDHLQVVVQPTNVFRKDGSTWRLAFDGQEVHLSDAKGLHDIATLLGTPGREVHVWTLLGSPIPRGGADPVLDEQARALFAARLAELDTEIAEADADQDVLRSEQACAERTALVHELAAAAGLGRRTRRLGDETERARKTVGARIRDVLVRIERVHPVLADHLRTTISTGTTCVYTPPDGCRWRV